MISIIVPVHNAENYIEETINSVLAQTHGHFELILVDDKSTDKSVEIIEHFDDARIKLVRLTENKGAAGARNEGLKIAEGRYIAYLDADDLWLPDKLKKELQYMKKYDAGFVFSAYEFGDENATPTGKIVRVPRELSYKDALSRTVIFTSTVLIDTKKVKKELLMMPQIESEDSATWWQILKTGVIAYGLNQPLAIYRRPANSLSSDKGVAVKRIWNLYRNYVGLGFFTSCYLLFLWAWRASVRRVVADSFRTHMESIKRFAVIQLSLLGLLFHALMYAWIWLKRYYPIINSIRISQDGYVFGAGLKLYFRGHLLIVIIYFLILLFCSRTGDGMRTGYVKPGNVFAAEAVALAVTNIITYLQLSIMNNWLVPIRPMAQMFVTQLLLTAIWAYIADAIYRNVFPAREALIVGSSDMDSERIEEIFSSRNDRFLIMKTMQPSDGIEKIKKECLRWYGCVILGEMDIEKKLYLTEYCFRHFIRVYIVPTIGDILVQGSEQLDLFGTTVFELREYSIRWESRVIKRIIDILVSLILIALLTPLMLCKLLGGSHIEKTSCYGKQGIIFERLSFSGEGIGKSIPSLFNVLKGDMSMVGTALYPKDKMQKLMDDEAEYTYRLRLKPGFTSYAMQHREGYSTEKDILKMDLYYIQHYSLILDIKLLLQAWRKKGAL